MNDTDEFRRLLSRHPFPVCAELTPFTILDADLDTGRVRMEFEAQPAFGNHFDAIQGGFAVAMLDAVVTLAAFAAVRDWLPTVEIKASFLEPLPIGACVGEGQVVKCGRQIVFVEGRLLKDGAAAVVASATLVRRAAGKPGT